MQTLQNLRRQISKIRQQKEPIILQLQSRLRSQEQTIKKLTQKIVQQKSKQATYKLIQLENYGYVLKLEKDSNQKKYLMIDVSSLDSNYQLRVNTQTKFMTQNQLKDVDVKDKGKQTSNLSSDQQMFVEEIKNLQEIVSNLRTEMDDLKLKYQLNLSRNITLVSKTNSNHTPPGLLKQDMELNGYHIQKIHGNYMGVNMTQNNRNIKQAQIKTEAVDRLAQQKLGKQNQQNSKSDNGSSGVQQKEMSNQSMGKLQDKQKAIQQNPKVNRQQSLDGKNVGQQKQNKPILQQKLPVQQPMRQSQPQTNVQMQRQLPKQSQMQKDNVNTKQDKLERQIKSNTEQIPQKRNVEDQGIISKENDTNAIDRSEAKNQGILPASQVNNKQLSALQNNSEKLTQLPTKKQEPSFGKNQNVKIQQVQKINEEQQNKNSAFPNTNQPATKIQTQPACLISSSKSNQQYPKQIGNAQNYTGDSNNQKLQAQKSQHATQQTNFNEVGNKGIQIFDSSWPHLVPPLKFLPKTCPKSFGSQLSQISQIQQSDLSKNNESLYEINKFLQMNSPSPIRTSNKMHLLRKITEQRQSRSKQQSFLQGKDLNAILSDNGEPRKIEQVKIQQNKNQGFISQQDQLLKYKSSNQKQKNQFNQNNAAKTQHIQVQTQDQPSAVQVNKNDQSKTTDSKSKLNTLQQGSTKYQTNSQKQSQSGNNQLADEGTSSLKIKEQTTGQNSIKGVSNERQRQQYQKQQAKLPRQQISLNNNSNKQLNKQPIQKQVFKKQQVSFSNLSNATISDPQKNNNQFIKNNSLAINIRQIPTNELSFGVKSQPIILEASKLNEHKTKKAQKQEQVAENKINKEQTQVKKMPNQSHKKKKQHGGQKSNQSQKAGNSLNWDSLFSTSKKQDKKQKQGTTEKMKKNNEKQKQKQKKQGHLTKPFREQEIITKQNNHSVLQNQQNQSRKQEEKHSSQRIQEKQSKVQQSKQKQQIENQIRPNSQAKEKIAAIQQINIFSQQQTQKQKVSKVQDTPKTQIDHRQNETQKETKLGLESEQIKKQDLKQQNGQTVNQQNQQKKHQTQKKKKDEQNISKQSGSLNWGSLFTTYSSNKKSSNKKNKQQSKSKQIQNQGQGQKLKPKETKIQNQRQMKNQGKPEQQKDKLESGNDFDSPVKRLNNDRSIQQSNIIYQTPTWNQLSQNSKSKKQGTAERNQNTQKQQQFKQAESKIKQQNQQQKESTPKMEKHESQILRQEERKKAQKQQQQYLDQLLKQLNQKQIQDKKNDKKQGSQDISQNNSSQELPIIFQKNKELETSLFQNQGNTILTNPVQTVFYNNKQQKQQKFKFALPHPTKIRSRKFSNDENIKLQTLRKDSGFLHSNIPQNQNGTQPTTPMTPFPTVTQVQHKIRKQTSYNLQDAKFRMLQRQYFPEYKSEQQLSLRNGNSKLQQSSKNKSKSSNLFKDYNAEQGSPKVETNAQSQLSNSQNNSETKQNISAIQKMQSFKKKRSENQQNQQFMYISGVFSQKSDNNSVKIAPIKIQQLQQQHKLSSQQSQTKQQPILTKPKQINSLVNQGVKQPKIGTQIKEKNQDQKQEMQEKRNEVKIQQQISKNDNIESVGNGSQNEQKNKSSKNQQNKSEQHVVDNEGNESYETKNKVNASTDKKKSKSKVIFLRKG